MHWIGTLTAAVAVLLAASASAQEPARPARQHGFDFSIGAAYLDSATTDFDGGTVVSSESTTGLGFGFDYHFADRWSAGVQLAMHSVDYVGDIAVITGGAAAPGELVSGDLDTSSVVGHVKRWFGSWDRVAPYALAGLGFASIDTNIPEGPPIGTCWWHPWWGFVCNAVQPTRTTTDLARTLGVGVRWDFGRRLFLDAGIGRQWIDFDNAHRPGFSTLRVAVGFR